MGRKHRSLWLEDSARKAWRGVERYLRLCLSVGTVPCLLGTSEAARGGRAKGLPGRAFEDAVVWCVDFGSLLSRLPELDRRMLEVVILGGSTIPDAAKLLGVSPRSVQRRMRVALMGVGARMVELGL